MIAQLGKFQFQRYIEESVLHYVTNLIVNQSISCDKHVALIHYKVGQSLIQSGARIITCANFVTKWGKNNYKVGKLRIITKGQKILKSRAVNPLQNGVIIITQRGIYYKKSRFTTKWTRYYKLGQELSQSAAGYHYKVGQSLQQSAVGIINQDNFIAKWNNCYRKGQYLFVTLGQIETYVY